MRIVVQQPGKVLDTVCQRLGLPMVDSNDHVNDEFLAALIRHCAGFICPCSAISLRNTIFKSLEHLVHHENLSNRIDDAIDGLTVGGDLLELHQVTTSDIAARGTWLFAAPPGFIERKSGNIFLVGTVTDQDTYLPDELTIRIVLEGYSRIIKPASSDEDLMGELADLGFQHIFQKNWLKFPEENSAKNTLSKYTDMLSSNSHSGDIAGLDILDPEKSVSYYPKRWIKLKKQSGVFVARRQQDYGSPIWCLVKMENGATKKLLDLPLPKERWRGCDVAWHIQMAIDHLRDNPQIYRVQYDENCSRIDFFSPIPLWAQRRLMIVGQKVTPEQCLLSFQLPESELEEEEQFIQENLWLHREA